MQDAHHQSDVIVISSDLIIEFPPHILIDGFRALNGSMTALFYEVCKGDTECRSSKDEGECFAFN